MHSAGPTTRPIDDFCNAIENCPDSVSIGMWWRIALGLPPAEAADPRERMEYLLNHVGIDDRFLINGLLSFFVEIWEGLCDDTRTNRTIDSHLEQIEIFERQLQLPPEQRTISATDEQLQGMVDKVKELAGDITTDKRRATETYEYLENLRSNVFSRDYWRGHL
jgi:hypothetical protein